MGIAKELLKKITPKEFVKKHLDNIAEKLVAKGSEISDTDLYMLCLINQERDELNAEEKCTKKNNGN